ncbi:hypothetical protein A3C96_00160 [Candidatus Uhrbacteria bacterium RIFCSPHIGHO2_02_FULL_60_10]|uniref:DUF2975 domain-containing protein n=1 Tax=Candidatus Uhrbacteria bacterium RIFCSPHIGHO2_02_FULL_60_10 TaxID=1802392 RepID=A0A1F7U6X0_9BACT|nr:MAG: hypothetical protein A3C96_00160 [Candidatus Uhrbacteria bacterium RIFCSPHIGHO2_02_FULL_60_10]
MSLRLYLTVMSLITAATWATVGLIVTQTDPAAVEPSVIVVFYAAMALALAGTFAVIGLLARLWILRKTFLLSRQVWVSVRQSFLLAGAVSVALFLQSRALLTWRNGAVIVASMTVLEFIFIALGGIFSADRHRPVRSRELSLK